MLFLFNLKSADAVMARQMWAQMSRNMVASMDTSRVLTMREVKCLENVLSGVNSRNLQDYLNAASTRLEPFHMITLDRFSRCLDKKKS